MEILKAIAAARWEQRAARSRVAESPRAGEPELSIGSGCGMLVVHVVDSPKLDAGRDGYRPVQPLRRRVEQPRTLYGGLVSGRVGKRVSRMPHAIRRWPLRD